MPIHSIAPRISNQFPRSIANHKEPEILRCRFGTKYFPWFLSDDRRAPLTSIGSALVIFGYLALALLYLNESSFTASEIYDDASRLLQPSRYFNVSTRFKYFVANEIAIDRIRLMYVRRRPQKFSILTHHEAVIKISSFIVFFIRYISAVYLTIAITILIIHC